MEPNAASRKKLTVPQGCLLSYNTGIAADGQNLYLLLLDYDANAMQITNTALCRTNFDENKLERLCQLGKEREGNIIGVYPEGLVLQRSWISSNMPVTIFKTSFPTCNMNCSSIPFGKIA